MDELGHSTPPAEPVTRTEFEGMWWAINELHADVHKLKFPHAEPVTRAEFDKLRSRVTGLTTTVVDLKDRIAAVSAVGKTFRTKQEACEWVYDWLTDCC